MPIAAHTEDTLMAQWSHLPHYDSGHACNRLELIEAQAHWEMAGVSRGVDRYRAIMARREVDERTDSQPLVRRLVPPLVSQIEATQAEADLELATARSVRTSGAKALLVSLPADEQAVITLSTVLRGVLTVGDHYNAGDAAVTGVARTIAQTALDQAQYNRWVNDQKAVRKADPTAADLVKRLAKRHPELTQSVWHRVRVRLDVARAIPPSEADRIQYGAMLVSMLVDVSDGALELKTVQIGSGRTEARVAVSAEILEELEDRAVRAEVARPLLMPMISPPNDWRY